VLDLEEGGILRAEAWNEETSRGGNGRGRSERRKECVSREVWPEQQHRVAGRP
jgi:hypothetical protein